MPACEHDAPDLWNIMLVDSPLACALLGLCGKLQKACLEQKDAAFTAHLQFPNAASIQHQHVLTNLQQALMPVQ